MRNLILVATVSMLLTGCATNVLFSDIERLPHPEQNVISLVYDRYGDLYPSDRVHIPARALRQNRRRSENELALAPYFEDQWRRGSEVWRKLLAEAPFFTPGADTSFPLAWNDVQANLRQRAVQRINHLTQNQPGAPRRTLVVLVHGFNNDKTEALTWYNEVRQVVRGHLPDAVFLDVFWDGLSAKLPPGIWSSAQYNFPLVGLELRRVLNAIDQTIPLRVITHSSGGPLFASTMGDASAPLPSNDAHYQRYRSLVVATNGDYMPPNPPDYRVGMIVPAAASTTFARYGQNFDGPDRIIIGINPLDFAISKVIMPCTFIGSTCMSGSRSDFCSDVVPIFASSPSTKLFVFDFSHSGRNERQGLFWDAHSVEAYLRRDDMGRFLEVLLGEDTTDSGEQSQICRRR